MSSRGDDRLKAKRHMLKEKRADIGLESAKESASTRASTKMGAGLNV